MNINLTIGLILVFGLLIVGCETPKYRNPTCSSDTDCSDLSASAKCIKSTCQLSNYACPANNSLNCVAGGGPQGSEQYDLCQNQDYQAWMFDNCPNAEILE